MANSRFIFAKSLALFSTPACAFLQNEHTKDFDQRTETKNYVVLGYGTAGENATYALKRVLRDKPERRIIVIDKQAKRDEIFEGDKDKVTFIEAQVTSLESEKGEISIIGKSQLKKTIAYEKCLISTGVTNRLNLKGYFDKKIEKFVLQLDGENEIKKAVDIVRNGGSVVIIGTSWETLKLAFELQDVIKKEERTKKMGDVCLILPGYGPLDHILPNFVSLAIIKRLKKLGVTVNTHSSLRYVSARKSNNEKDVINGPFPIRVYTCRSHDQLDTSSFDADLVVLSRINKQVDPFVRESNVGLEIDKNGKMIVNKEMMATSKIYAAGNGVSIPNSSLGRINCTKSKYDSKIMGIVAGTNMGKDGHNTLKHEFKPYFCDSILNAGINISIFGDCSSSYNTHSFWWKGSSISSSEKSERRKTTAKNFLGAGIIYYVLDGIVRGIVSIGLSAHKNDINLEQRVIKHMSDLLDESKLSPFMKTGTMLTDTERSLMKDTLKCDAFSILSLKESRKSTEISNPVYRFKVGNSKLHGEVNNFDKHILEKRKSEVSQGTKEYNAFMKATSKWKIP